MADAETNPTPEITLPPAIFTSIENTSRKFYDKEVEALNYDEAAQLIGALMIAMSEPDFTIHGTATMGGDVLLDSFQDGRQAFDNFLHQMVRKILPQIDDERELTMHVLRPQTDEDTQLGRKPEIDRTYHFRNTPPDYV